MRLISSLSRRYSSDLESLLNLVRHQTDLLSTKDPMTFQAVAAPQMPVYSDYDPSDEAEIQRLRERGLSDSAIYDEWSSDDSAEFAAIRSELLGE